MAKLSVFESISIDGFFTDADGDMGWAHRPERDPEFEAFTRGNASGDGILVFGRKTYDLMASFWPTEMAKQQMPEVAARMNDGSKLVFSRKLKKAGWKNTRLVNGDPVAEIRRLKAEGGPDMVVLGSGEIASQFMAAGLVDLVQLVVIPIALGKGRTLFETMKDPASLKLRDSRAFANGNVVLTYIPGA